MALFTLLMNVFNAKSNKYAEAKLSIDKNDLETEKYYALIPNDLSQARKQLREAFDDLEIILESFYSLYSCEVINKSEQCDFFQQEAIRLVQHVKDRYLSHPRSHEAWFEFLRYSDTFSLFQVLQQLKNYRDELPTGWYESIKLPINNINEAKQFYQRSKGE